MILNLVGQVLSNRYRVDNFLGKGGMAEVYKVWDQSRLAELAIKILRSQFLENWNFLNHFRAEAKTLARLQHPNIVRFYSLEQDGGIVFIVMDFVEGNTLREEMRTRGIFPAQRILQIMRDVCGALNYAHETGYIHCDIKPANIMINKSGTALVSDFGIARLAGGAPGVSARGGTAGYMSPEQIQGETPTRAADIYALGILIFEMLTGVRPFTGQVAQTAGSTSERIRWEQIHSPPPSPRQYNPNISIELERIVLCCLEKDPAKRYPNVKRLLSALEQSLLREASRSNVGQVPSRPFIKTELPQKRTVPLPVQNRRTKKTWGWLLIAIPIIVLLVLIAGGWSGSPSEPTPPFTVRPYNSSLDKDADCIMCRLPSDWEEPTVPGSYQWDITFPADTPVRIQLGWCAVDQTTLDAAWPLISYDDLAIDGHQIKISQLTLQSGKKKNGDVCYVHGGIVVDWSKGHHQYTQILYYSRTLSDGRNTYEAGKYIYNFMVVVQ